MTNRLRICCEKYLDKDLDTIEKIDNNISNNLRAAFLFNKLWNENQTITIGFFGHDNQNLEYTPLSYLAQFGMDPIEKEINGLHYEDAVKKVILERIQPIVGLKFQFVENVKDAMIRISFEDDGAWSYVGKDALDIPKDQATMNFGWLDASTIMHEFGHCLGMIHEHQNPRGEGIDWDKEKVYEWARQTQGWSRLITDTNILNHYSKNITNGSQFDDKSIMLYFFPGFLTKNGVGTDQNLKLSKEDVLWLNKKYPNSKMTPEEFYEKVYGMDINNTEEETEDCNHTEEEKDTSKLEFWAMLFFLFVVFVIIVIIFKRISSNNSAPENQIYGAISKVKNEMNKEAGFSSYNMISDNTDTYSISSADNINFASFISLLK